MFAKAKACTIIQVGIAFCLSSYAGKLAANPLHPNPAAIRLFQQEQKKKCKLKTWSWEAANPEINCACSTGDQRFRSCSHGPQSPRDQQSAGSDGANKLLFSSWMHDTTVLLMGALLRGWNTLNNNLLAFVASLLHWFQVPAGSAQAEQVVLVNNWHGLSRQSDGESNASPGGDVSVCAGDGTHSPCRGLGNLSRELSCSLPSQLQFTLCVEVPISNGNIQTQQNNRSWESFPNSSMAQKPMGWVCSGERGPLQTAKLSSQIWGQTWTWGDRSRFLLFKQQPHVQIPLIKSRRRFSRQGDKNPFWTCNFLSYLGLLQS